MSRKDPLSLRSTQSSEEFFENINIPSLALEKAIELSHQIQVNRSNYWKQKEVHNLDTHVRATILVAKERSKPEGDRRTTLQVIDQVVAEFQLRVLRVTLAKTTINR